LESKGNVSLPILKENDFNSIKSEIINFLRRGVSHQLLSPSPLLTSVSVRIPQTNDFVITPLSGDLMALEPSSLVFFSSQENLPCDAQEHFTIYSEHEEINSIIMGTPGNIMAFCHANPNDEPCAFDSRIIPECYVVLRKVRMITFDQYLTSLFGQNKPSTFLFLLNCFYFY
jgi:hypothetical protein